MATFTVQFEIGPETRALLERLIDKSAIQIELGPGTLATAREVLAARTPTAEHAGTSAARVPPASGAPPA